jgi:hypothetical protein
MVVCGGRWGWEGVNSKHEIEKEVPEIWVGYWEIGILGYWDIGILGYWDIGKLGYWEIGILGNWEIGKLGY